MITAVDLCGNYMGFCRKHIQGDDVCCSSRPKRQARNSNAGDTAYVKSNKKMNTKPLHIALLGSEYKSQNHHVNNISKHFRHFTAHSNITCLNIRLKYTYLVDLLQSINTRYQEVMLGSLY